MRAHGGLSLAQALMAASAPMLIQRAVVDGDPDSGLMATGLVAGRIDDVPSCQELVDAIVRDARMRIDALATIRAGDAGGGVTKQGKAGARPDRPGPARDWKFTCPRVRGRAPGLPANPMPTRIEIQGHIAEIILDHPPVNALNSAAWNELPAIISHAGEDPNIRCVLLRAEGKGFCAGVDIKEMQAHPERIVELNDGNYRSFKAVRDCPVPVVTAAHGFVIGGGIGLCGASDTIIAAENCFFSLPEIDRGAMGGAPICPACCRCTKCAPCSLPAGALLLLTCTAWAPSKK